MIDSHKQRKVNPETKGSYRLSILFFLAKNSGRSWNTSEIYRKLPKKGVNRIVVKEICDELVRIDYVEAVKPRDARAKNEYKITPEGLNYFNRVVKERDFMFFTGQDDSDTY